jgi:hypothetical protein
MSGVIKRHVLLDRRSSDLPCRTASNATCALSMSRGNFADLP